MNDSETTKPAPADVTLAAAVWTAIVAGAFSLIVCAALVWNYRQARKADPLDSPELAVLAQEIARRPGDEALGVRYRTVELELRKEHFRRESFARRGGYLLLGGAGVFVAALAVAAWRRRRPPMPSRELPPAGRDALRASRARWSVGALGGALCGAAMALAIIASGRPTGGSAEPKQATSAPAPAVPELVVMAADQWARFRGPGGGGVSAHTGLPIKWDGKTGEGILWKKPVPLPGHSSPIVWGERLFLTGADKSARELYCYDAGTGKLLWRRQVKPPGSAEAKDIYKPGGIAAATPVTDGKRVCALFANGDVGCFDFEGRQLWAEALGPLENAYGHASSPVICGDLLLLQLDQASADDGKSYLLAMDLATGATVWDAPRPVGDTWSTPIVIQVGSTRQVIACGNPLVIAHDLASGREIWRADCLGGDQAPSPILAAGLVCVADSSAELTAIRPGGSGDVTKSGIAWRVEDGVPEIATPVTDGEHIFLAVDMLTCYEARTGKKLWEVELEDACRSSPALAEGRLYVLDDVGMMYVLQPGPQHREIARSRLGDNLTCHASPAFADGRIFIRVQIEPDEEAEEEDGDAKTENHLYCVGKAKK